jgi:hypothetical protein
MRTCYIALLLAGGLGLTSCNRTDEPRREPAARQAGREMYRATQDVKRDAKEAGQQLKKAGKEFREGWSEAKHQDPPRSRK